MKFELRLQLAGVCGCGVKFGQMLVRAAGTAVCAVICVHGHGLLLKVIKGNLGFVCGRGGGYERLVLSFSVGRGAWGSNACRN